MRDLNLIQKLPEDQPITVTRMQLAEFTKNTVHATLVEMGLKPHRLAAGRIYRPEMVEVIGRRPFDQAVREGKIKTWKLNPLKKNSKVYARRSDWEKYLRSMFNKEV